MMLGALSFCKKNKTTSRRMLEQMVLGRILSRTTTTNTVERMVEDHEMVGVFVMPEVVGRGLYAKVDIVQGSVVHREVPLVSTAPVSKKGLWCSVCMDPSHVTCGEGEGVWRGLERSCDWSALYAYCSGGVESNSSNVTVPQLKFPLLVARLACMKMCGQSKDDLMKFLCYVNVDNGDEGVLLREEWRVGYEALVSCLHTTRHGNDINNIPSFEWYVSMMSRIHCNAFAVDVVDMVGLGQDYAAVLRSGLYLSPDAGSAVYLLGSLFNHSCVPNVDVSFPRNNHEIEFRAMRDIKKHEHLCVSYIDSTLPYQERQRRLEMGYGFRCMCDACREDMSTGVV
jgi:hypothetical protein